MIDMIYNQSKPSSLTSTVYNSNGATQLFLEVHKEQQIL